MIYSQRQNVTTGNTTGHNLYTKRQRNIADVQEKLRIKSEHLHNKVLKRNYIFTYGGMLTEGNLSLSDPFKFVNLNIRCVHRKLDHTQAVRIIISKRL
jgi:hypothetical protein